MQSFWATQLPPDTPRPPLNGDRSADVCVVGAGYTGLWTAYELKLADPTLEIVVLDAGRVGDGASGCNGGWVVGEVAGSRAAWAQRGGRSAVLALEGAMRTTVDEIGAVVERERISCAFVKGGSLTIARSPLQLARITAQLKEERQWGWTPEDSVLLDAEETRQRVMVDRAVGARFTPHCARIQPVQLARGLAAVASRAGVTVHEHTPAHQVEPRTVRTSRGVISAKYVVRATEGYTARLADRRRELLPLRSCMIVTEPLGDEAWRQLRWERCETVMDGQHLFVYLQRTADGRVAIGGSGVPYRYGSRIVEGPLEQGTIGELRSRLAELFPALRDAKIDGACHGVLGVSRDGQPSVGLDRRTGMAWAGGYVGEGVAAANLAGRTLRDLILGRDSELTRLPWVVSSFRKWEPEPLRYIGVRCTFALMRLADQREARTGRPSLAAKLAGFVAGQ